MVMKQLTFFLMFFVFTAHFLSVNAQSDKGNEEELLALQYFNAGEFDKAVILYEKLYRRNASIYNYNYYFECLMALEEYDKGEKLVQKLVKQEPGIFRYQVDLGLIAVRKGDVKKSEKAFSDAIAGVLSTEDNYSALAQYFIYRNLQDWAVKTYEYGLNRIASSVLMRYELTALYLQAGRNNDMFEQFYSLIDNPIVSVEDVQQRLLAYFSADQTKQLSESFVNYALRQAQKNAQNTAYAEMLLWAYLQVSDYSKALQQAIAMDRRQKVQGEIVLSMIPLLSLNKEFDKAIEGLNYVLDMGENSLNYNSAQVAMFDVRYLKAISILPPDRTQLLMLEQEIIDFVNEAGMQLNTVALVMQLAAVQAFYLEKPQDAKHWVEQAMKVQGVRGLLAAELKILLADIMLLTGEHWDASLLYSQVEKDFKHDTIGYKAKFKNAQFYFYIGEFDYALTHLSILRAATSKLIANDAMELSLFIANNIDYDSSFVPLAYYSRAQFAWKCKRPLAAITTLDSLLNIFPGHPVRDDAYFMRAEIYFQMQEYQKAAADLHSILAAHYFDLLADDALFLLAGIYKDQLNNMEKAMELYWQVVEDFPSSVYAQESRDYYRHLRDNMPAP
jgi:tetratricopeptide (TPR) repeat protein